MNANAAQLLTDDRTFASVLLAILIDRFGDTFVSGEDGQWTPETLKLEIKDAFGVEISESNLGKIIAAASLLTTDNFYRGISSFLFAVHGLLGDGTDWSYAEPIDVDDLAWALTEAILLSPPADGDSFDSEISAYCRLLLKREGIMSPPAILSFVEETSEYENITEYDEDVMQEQSQRTRDIDESVDERLNMLIQQVSEAFNKPDIAAALEAEIELLSAKDEWR